MSWDASRIAVRTLDGGETKIVAGGADEGVGQPRFSPDGTHLAWVSDRSGVTNVWVGRADGTGAKPLVAETDEHAPPAWGPGQRTYAWSPDGASSRGAATSRVSGASSPARSTARRSRASSRRPGTAASRGRTPASSRCAPARARRRRSSSPTRPPANAGRSRAVRSAGSRPPVSSSPSRSRGSRGAPPFTACSTGPRRARSAPAPPAALRAHPRRSDRARSRPSGTAHRLLGLARLGRARAQLPGLVGLRPRVRAGAARAVGRRRRRRHRGRDPARDQAGVVRPGAGRGRRWQRGRHDRVAAVRVARRHRRARA